MFRAFSTSAVAGLLLLITAPLMAGGPARLCLPISGVTASNAATCAELISGGLKDKLRPDDGRSGVEMEQHQRQWYALFYLAGESDVGLSDVDAALEGSEFSVPRDGLRFFGPVQLDVEVRATAQEALLEDLVALKHVQVEESSRTEGGLLVTMVLPENGRRSIFQLLEGPRPESQVSGPSPTVELLPSPATLCDLMAQHDARLNDIRWSGQWHCRMMGCLAVAVKDGTLETVAEDPVLWSRAISTGVNGVTDLAFSPDGKLIAVSAWDATVRLCRAEDGRTLHTLRVCEHVAPGHRTAPAFAVDFSPCGQFLAVGVAKGKGNAAQVWRVADQKLVHSFRDTSYVSSVAFSPDGQLLAVAQHRLILLYEIKRGELVRTLSGHVHNISDVAFSPDGRWLVSVGFDRTVRFWNALEGELLATLSGHVQSLDAVAFSPDGSLIASAGSDKTIRLWHISRPAGKRDLELTPAGAMTGHKAPVNSLAFSPDGRLLVSGSGTADRRYDREENAIRLWSVSDGKPLRVMRRSHTEPVMAVAFSPDGTSFVSGSLDHNVVHWSLNHDKLP